MTARSACPVDGGYSTGVTSPVAPVRTAAAGTDPVARRGDVVRAVTWHGRRDVRADTVPDPSIEKPTDVVVKITSSGICGSDLHLHEVLGPFLHRWLRSATGQGIGVVTILIATT